MFLAASFLTLSLALAITGSPVEVHDSLITLPLTRRLNFSNGTINFLQHDKARVAAYNTHDRLVGTLGRRADSIPVKHESTFLDYSVAVGIGTPPITYNLVLDTSSSVTWVGADKQYVRTSTSFISGRQVEVLYGPQSTGTECFFSGDIFLDTITLGGGITVTWFQLGVASDWSGFRPGEDGILGIGPEGLNRGTIPNDPDDTIPSFTDYLFLQKQIDRHVVGIFFQPVTTQPDSEFGGITFGGTDNTKYIGNIVYTPITTMPPSSRYWGINQRITYGSRTILGLTSGTVDTGTTFIMLPSDCFEMYKAATGGTYDQATDLLRITPNQYNALQDLDFHIEGQVFSLTPNAQIWPRFLNTKIPNGVDGVIYLIVQSSGTYWGQGDDDFTIGYTFIQRFYTVLDGSRSRIGFAATPFTRATTN